MIVSAAGDIIGSQFFCEVFQSPRGLMVGRNEGSTNDREFPRDCCQQQARQVSGRPMDRRNGVGNDGLVGWPRLGNRAARRSNVLKSTLKPNGHFHSPADNHSPQSKVDLYDDGHAFLHSAPGRAQNGQVL